MANRKLFLGLAALGLMAGSPLAEADTLKFKVNNKSGQAINVMSAVPKAGGTSITLTTGAIAATTTGSISFTAPANTCVFALTTTLANGRVIASPDTDLCQTDMLIVQ